jgi:hypothetical protein
MIGLLSGKRSAEIYGAMFGVCKYEIYINVDTSHAAPNQIAMLIAIAAAQSQAA